MSNLHLARAAAVGALAILAACGRSGAPAGAAGGPTPLPSRPPRNGLEVIGWMRRAHPSRELRSLAFLQTTYDSGRSASVESRVYASLPGKMRVDLLPVSSRSGYVHDRQRLAVFRAGRRVSTVNRVDLRTLLAFDLFAQAIDTTIMWLDTARVRFGLHRRGEWDGRPVWIVGALEGDLTSSQFWVDAERWRVVRVIQREPRPPNLVFDVRYLEFTELLDVPVPTRVQLWREGKLVEEQLLTEFAINPSLPRRTFDLSRWRAIKLGT